MLESRTPEEHVQRCKCASTVWMFRPEKRPCCNYPGRAHPRAAALGAALFLAAVQLADPLLQLPGRLIGCGERRIASAASLHQRCPDGCHQLGSAHAEKQGAVRVCGEIHLFWTGIFVPSAEQHSRLAFHLLRINTSQRLSQYLPAGAEAKPRPFVFFRGYTAASLLINSTQTKS